MIADGGVPASIDPADYAAVRVLDIPDPTTGQRLIAYRLSAIGHCATSLVALRLGHSPMPPPANMQVRFDDGHLHESSILSRAAELESMKLFRIDPESDQDEVVLRIGSARAGMIVGIGHIDALGAHPIHGPVVIDAKALSQSSWELWCRGEFNAWPNYAWQLSGYSYALGKMRADLPEPESTVGEFPQGLPLPIVMAVKNKNTGEVKCWIYPEPPIPLSEIKKKLLLVERQVDTGVLPECPKPEYLCPVWYLHSKDPTLDSDSSLPLDIDTRVVEAKGLRYQLLTGEIKALETEKESLRIDILAMMGDKAAVRGTNATVTTYSQANPPRFDKDRFARDHPEVVLDDYYSSSKSPRIRVTLRKK